MRETTILRLAIAIFAGFLPLGSSLPLAALKHHPATKALSTVYGFEQETWIENLRVRENGNVIITRFDNHPRLYEIVPSDKHPKPRLLAEFPQFTRDKSLAGITEISPDVFAFIVGPTRYDQSNHTLVVRGGIIDIYTIDLNLEDPQAQLLATINGGFANGFSTLPGTPYGLVGDSINGVIYRVNFDTGETEVAIEDVLLSPPINATLDIGVNGLQINEKGTIAYFANSARGLIASIPINSKTGHSTGDFQVLATKDVIFDDFAVADDALYVTADPEGQLFKLDLNTHELSHVIGQPAPSHVLPGATSAQFGRTKGTKNSLYITFNGGLTVLPFNETFVIPGGLMVLDLGLVQG